MSVVMAVLSQNETEKNSFSAVSIFHAETGMLLFLKEGISMFQCNAKQKITLGWLQRYLQSSPIYWKIVTSCFLQSFQNWEAENFFFKTQVAPVIE